MTLAIAGARPSQLKMRFRSVVSLRHAPAVRWIAIRPKFVPAPVSIAATQRARNWPAGSTVATTAQMPPATVRPTASRIGTVIAVPVGEAAGGSASTIGAAANRPSRTPTAHAAWPSRSASSGAAMRMPAMHE